MSTHPFLLLPVALLSGCAAHAPCASDRCRGDRDITSEVQALIREHPALEAPNSVRVQTEDGVVYLYGQVSTEVERSEAEALAHQVAGVRRVVDSISFGYEGR